MASHIEHWLLDRVIPYARNTRTHSDEQVAQIAGSIKEFGFVNPILVAHDRVIIAGHGRLLAARRLGMTEVPVIVIDGLLLRILKEHPHKSPHSFEKWRPPEGDFCAFFANIAMLILI